MGKDDLVTGKFEFYPDSDLKKAAGIPEGFLLPPRWGGEGRKLSFLTQEEHDLLHKFEDCFDKIRPLLRLMTPKWQWAAMDRDGKWNAFEEEPQVYESINSSWETELKSWEAPKTDPYPLDGFKLLPYPKDWKESKIKRDY